MRPVDDAPGRIAIATLDQQLRCVVDETRRRPLNLLAAAVHLGGLTRLASVAVCGPRNAFYSAMLVVELAEPLVLFYTTARLPQSG